MNHNVHTINYKNNYLDYEQLEYINPFSFDYYIMNNSHLFLYSLLLSISLYIMCVILKDCIDSDLNKTDDTDNDNDDINNNEEINEDDEEINEDDEEINEDDEEINDEKEIENNEETNKNTNDVYEKYPNLYTLFNNLNKNQLLRIVGTRYNSLNKKDLINLTIDKLKTYTITHALEHFNYLTSTQKAFVYKNKSIFTDELKNLFN